MAGIYLVHYKRYFMSLCHVIPIFTLVYLMLIFHIYLLLLWGMDDAARLAYIFYSTVPVSYRYRIFIFRLE